MVMFEEMIRQLDELDGLEIEISAKGVYPNRQRTPVQHVAKFQNDGTEHIEPARFVEEAERRNKRWWIDRLAEGAFEFVFEGHERDLHKAGRIMARDINDAVNRIDTRRLRRSFRHVIKK